jgi:hypothetical protein
MAVTASGTRLLASGPTAQDAIGGGFDDKLDQTSGVADGSALVTPVQSRRPAITS